MQRALAFLFCAFGMSGAVLGQTLNKKTIAVLDFDTRGAVTPGEAGTLTERLRSYLVHTGEFIVVERGKMESILQEQGFQQTGCASNECAAEMGRILDVQEMVAGAVGKIGSRYTLDVRLIDVETSRIFNTITKEYSGEAEGLIDLIELIAEQLAGKVGGLSVTTTPVPAAVFVDNKKIGVSPLKSFIVGVGEHAIRLVADGYMPIEYDVRIEKGKALRLTVKLKKKGGNIVFYVAGGVAIVGGTAAYYFLKPTATKELPEPPSLPPPP